MKSIPLKFSGILWSASSENLDLEKNRNYIINQVLAYGTWKSLKWLFKTYSSQSIKEVFLKFPQKIYTPSSFNFIKNILLSLRKKDLPEDKYVKNLPRNIRS